MKKMYLTPTTEEIEIELSGMLCVSDGDTNVYEEDYEIVGGSGDSGAIAE